MSSHFFLLFCPSSHAGRREIRWMGQQEVGVKLVSYAGDDVSTKREKPHVLPWATAMAPVASARARLDKSAAAAGYHVCLGHNY